MSSQSILSGIAASPGVAIGNAFAIMPNKLVNTELRIESSEIQSEIHKFTNAKESLIIEFNQAIEKTEIDDANVIAILETNALMLADEYINKKIVDDIEKGYSAESALAREFGAHKNDLMRAKDVIIREKAIEIDYIKNRLIAILRNQDRKIAIPKDSIVIAQSLNASDIVHFRQFNLKAIITEVGGIASHCAILARNYELPAIIGVKNALNIIPNAAKLIIDGFAGDIIIYPIQSTINKYKNKINDIEKRKKYLGKLVEAKSETSDGRTVVLSINLDTKEDLDSFSMLKADGIGLVRTENMMNERSQMPNEEEQFLWYKKIAEAAYPKMATIRLFDFGSDKFSDNIAKQEPNPALGFRGIRYLLARRDILRTQIRAVLRASILKNLRIMIPMLTLFEELLKVKEIVEECKSQLDFADIPFDNRIALGVMIETPSAALISSQLAKQADFFSLGANDLAQYTLASDRDNDLVSKIYDYMHPATLKLMKMAIKSAKKSYIPVSVCGEIAGDSAATSLLIGMGVNELSVSPSVLLETKQRIRNCSYSKLEPIANKAIKLPGANELRTFLASQKSN